MSNVNVNPKSKTDGDNSNEKPTGSVLDVLNVTNSILAILIIYVLYKLFGSKKKIEERLILPDPLPKHDMTLDELRKYNGKGPDKRICIAILGRVYDCTKGYMYYGPGRVYSTFAGRDVSRALAQFDVMAVKDEWDDITDLSQHEMSLVIEWNEQFQEKYDYVGRLVRSKEEILEKPDFEEDLDQDGNNTIQQSDNNGKPQSSTTDDEIEVINSEQESSSNEAATGASSASKKVSFIDVAEPVVEKKSSDSSDDIEVIEN